MARIYDRIVKNAVSSVARSWGEKLNRWHKSKQRGRKPVGKKALTGKRTYVDELRGSVLFSGPNGDTIWGKDTSITSRMAIGAGSMLGFTEYRLWAGFINCPVPLWGIRQIHDIVSNPFFCIFCYKDTRIEHVVLHEISQATLATSSYFSAFRQSHLSIQLVFARLKRWFERLVSKIRPQKDPISIDKKST